METFIQGKITDLQVEEHDGLRQMALGVEYLHAKHYVHGNIEPTNILVSKADGNASKVLLKICDFGCCRQSDGQFSHVNFEVTREYAAPELLQFLDKEADCTAKTASDVFSLGLVYFKLLTKGVHPFGGREDQVGERRDELSEILGNKQLGADRQIYAKQYKITSNIMEGNIINLKRTLLK